MPYLAVAAAVLLLVACGCVLASRACSDDGDALGTLLLRRLLGSPDAHEYAAQQLHEERSAHHSRSASPPSQRRSHAAGAVRRSQTVPDAAEQSSARFWDYVHELEDRAARPFPADERSAGAAGAGACGAAGAHGGGAAAGAHELAAMGCTYNMCAKERAMRSRENSTAVERARLSKSLQSHQL